MTELSKLIEEIIKQRSDLDEKTIISLINQKKAKVGSGYLTDSGAAFLVASDLNVFLEVMPKSDVLLSDITIGDNDITVIGRIFSIQSIKYFKRTDGKEGKYQQLIIFDKDKFVNLILWDDKVDLIVRLNLIHNILIKIEKAYIKSGLDGNPSIHLGNRGSIVIINEKNKNDKFPLIESLVKDVSLITNPDTNIVVTGKVKYPARISEYSNKEGKKGKVTQLNLDSLSNDSNIRAVIWNNTKILAESIIPNSIIRLIGVRSLLSKEGQIEIHGDNNTMLEIISIQESIKEEKKGIFRVLSIGKTRINENGKNSASILIVDNLKKYYTLILNNDAIENISKIKTNMLIECNYKEISLFTFNCSKEDSINVLYEDDESFPNLQDIVHKIKDIHISNLPISLEAISLSKVSSQEITTKRGETIEKRELIIGDETKEIKIIAWRELSDILNYIVPGQRIKISGVTAKRGLDGLPEIQINSFSQIEILS